MDDLSYDQKSDSEQSIISMAGVSIEALNEEVELERVDFETLLEEIRAS
ncbi:MAG: hypothetical protein IKZ29_01675 [Clostridiales bacterium]|jgi:hypothetical protein|nr:hypothetical protein [Clostridiales bacterium]MBR4430509.1 hypothetical protein [Clostridiales bacterium]MBR4947248.1 hypothetical protein [Clostridiales bacterium]